MRAFATTWVGAGGHHGVFGAHRSRDVRGSKGLVRGMMFAFDLVTVEDLEGRKLVENHVNFGLGNDVNLKRLERTVDPSGAVYQER